MREDAAQTVNWARRPLVATIERLLCRELTLQNEHLQQENKVLRKDQGPHPGPNNPLNGENAPAAR